MKKGWPTKRLGDLFVFKNGRAFKKEEWTKKGLPIIRIQNLNNEDAPFNYFAGEYSQDILVEPGDLLFSWSGTVGSSFGSHLWNGEPGVLNQHIFKIGLLETITKRYAFHGLRYITAEIEQSVNGAVGLVHITKEKLNEFTLPVPPLAEQQRIVGLLDEAFGGLATAKANAEKNLQNARALFESHLQSVFTQRGPGWVEKTFEDCIEDVKYTTKIQRKDFLEEGEFPIVSQEAEFTNGYWDNAADVFKVTRPVVIFGDHTQVLKYIDFDFVLGADGVKLLPPKPFLNAKFFLYALRSAPLKSLGYARHYRLLKELQIGYPDTTAQVAIAKKLDTLEAETQRLAHLYQQKLAALEALKKSLLHQAFTGKL